MHQPYPDCVPFSSPRAFFAQFDCAPDSAHHTARYRGAMVMTRERDLQALQSAFETFTACMSMLAVPVFLRRATEWAPRDVVAHLIGWNRSTRTGCEQIR